MSKNTQLGNLVNGVYVDSSGRVGIANTSPSVALDVTGAGKFSGVATVKSCSIVGTNGYSGQIIQQGDIVRTAGTNLLIQSSTGNSIGFLTNGGTTFNMFINSSGNVGIGTTSPSQALSVEDTILIKDTQSSASQLIFGDAANDFAGRIFYNHGSDAMQFFVNASERMRITSGGSVGIGTSSPSTWPYPALQIKNGAIASETYGTTSFTWVGANWSNDGVTEKFIVNGRAALLTLVNGGLLFNFTPSEGTAGSSITFTQAFRIVNNGNIIIGTGGDAGYKLYVNGTYAGTSAFQNVSDGRFKKDITPVENALTKINQLNGISFNWDKEKRPDLNLDDNNHLGLIAQDVEKILPQVVLTGEDELETKTISYSDIVPVLIEAIKELSKEIEILKQK